MSIFDVASRLITRPEIEVAVNWWADVLLHGGRHDAGDAKIDMMASWASSKVERPDKRVVEKFRVSLAALTACIFVEHWHEDEPKIGSGLRTLSVDYGPDHTLRCALEYAGLRDGYMLLPIKTVMWISPESVKVRPGYSGQEVEIYATDTTSDGSAGQ